MPATRSLIRLAVNVALDAVLAAMAVPVARWIADPTGNAMTPFWLIPAGAAALLIGGVEFSLLRGSDAHPVELTRCSSDLHGGP